MKWTEKQRKLDVNDLRFWHVKDKLNGSSSQSNERDSFNDCWNENDIYRSAPMLHLDYFRVCEWEDLVTFSSKFFFLVHSGLPTAFLRKAADLRTMEKKLFVWFWATFNTGTSKMSSPKGERTYKVLKSNLLKRCRQFLKLPNKLQFIFFTSILSLRFMYL